jgi:peptide/nickel transport system permease protein
MARYVAQRLALLVGVLFVVSFLVFLMVRLIPGDPVLNVTGVPQSAADDCEEDPTISNCDEILADIEEARAELNLDEPLPVAYAQWIGDLLPPDVDLGYSYIRNTEVSELIGTAIPRTGLLMLYSVVVSVVLAIPLGVLAAYRAGGWIDKIISTTAFGIIAIPNFVVAVVLSYVFAVKLDWFPGFGAGVVDLGDGSLVEHFKSYTLPVFSLALGQIAVFARLLRTDMVSTLQEDYIGMAKAKGMPVRTILFRHALRPSSFTLLTVVGLTVGQLIGGAVIIEFLFSINGMGSQIAAGVLRSDYTVVQSGVVIIAAAFVTLNFAVDLLYGVLDPRVRHARAH